MKPTDYSQSMFTTRSRLGLPPLNKRRKAGRLSTATIALAILLGHVLLGLVAWAFN